MKRLTALTVILTPTVYAADISGTAGLPHHIESARSIVYSWEEATSGIAKELQFFHSSLPQIGNSTELPESENGDAVIVCDRGMLFDAKTSRMVYIGNVRMRDSRLTLRARDALYLRLEELKSEPTEKEPHPQPQKEVEKTPTVAPEKGAANASASSETISKSTGSETSEQGETELPLHIETCCAEANVVDNRIILYSPAGAKAIVLTRGEDVLRAVPTADSPAYMLADAEGNVLIEAADIYLSYTHPEKGKSTVSAKGGPVYYHAANNTLYLSGDIQLTHPDGNLSCTESLCLVMTPAENPAPVKPGFMSQFTGMRFSGISMATAKGNVVAETSGVNGSSPGTAQGDVLVYNGNTGDCSITGKNSRLTYGEHNSIFANEGIYLLANGDIELRGTNIHGTYERPAQKKETATVQGSFRAGGNIIFNAETGHVTTDKGLIATDSEIDFSCTGAVMLTLEKTAGIEKPEQKKGIPNLAITEYNDIVTITADGQVRIKQLDQGKEIGSLTGEHAFVNLANGSAILSGSAETPAVLVHENGQIVATPGEMPPVLDMQENGDILLTGKDINLRLQGKNGLTTASGKNSMKLIRAENRIVSGSGVVITSPSAIITTNSILTAKLRPAAGAEPDTGHAFSKHSVNYDGIESADTDEGGTVRTEKGSMQCTGAIHVIMNPNADPKDEMAGIRSAVATGNVMLLTKDSTNQMIRAKGDRLNVNGNTGMKSLTGREVILETENNRHVVSGKGAAVHVDKKNNVRISGEKHDTQVTRLNEQSAKHKKNNSNQQK